MSGKTPARPIVHLVDDDSATRKALAWSLESAGLGVRSFASGMQFLDEYDPTLTGCLVLDVRLPKMSGLQVQQEIAKRGWTLPVIFTTGFGEVEIAVQAMQAGAIDFLEKPFDNSILIGIIRFALLREERERQARQQHLRACALLARLTPRERDVVRMVIAGTANKCIAADLGISERTVEAHRKQAMLKLEVVNLPALVQLAMWAERADSRLLDGPQLDHRNAPMGWGADASLQRGWGRQGLMRATA